MKIEGKKILKAAVPIASIIVTLASGYISKKDQEEEIQKRVNEAVANINKN